ncbi:MAG TPA: S8 family serine peptidase [Blastocatellia bacterium]|nr:S8 family serine peptidase [Blastocatellia bacterium]
MPTSNRVAKTFMQQIMAVAFCAITAFTPVLQPAAALAQPQATPPVKRHARAEAAFAELMDKANNDGPVRVIVGLRHDARAAESAVSEAQAMQQQRSAVARAQDGLLAQMDSYRVQSVKRFNYIPFVALKTDAAGLRFLQTSDAVLTIEEDDSVPPTLARSVGAIGAKAVWESGFSGAGQAVAILDTGVDKAHSFLNGKVVAEACYSTTDPDRNVASVCPGGASFSTAEGSGVPCTSGCEHGTHVAGIAAGKGDTSSGVAKEAKIVAIQIFSRFDNASDCGGSAPCVRSFQSDQIRGMERVLELSQTLNIAAVNMSLGSGKYIANCDALRPATKAAIDNLRARGVATIVSSGNGSALDGVSTPACISSAISVGSTRIEIDANNVVTAESVASSSNSGAYLKLLAPGVAITSSVPGGGFATYSGTSMAAPHVAGAWAVLKSKYPNASVDEVLMALSNNGQAVTDARNNITKPRLRLSSALGGVGCNYGLNQNAQTFATAGGKGSIQVTANGANACGWNVFSDVDWIKVDSGENGTGNATVNFTVAALDKGARIGTLTVAGKSFTVTQGGTMAVVSAASYVGPDAARDSIVSAFGERLATETRGVTGTTLPTTLGGTMVRVRDITGIERSAPLFYVSPTQVNFQVPPGTSIGNAIITITSGDGAGALQAVQIAAVTPAIFSADATGKGLAAALVQRIEGGKTLAYEQVAQFDSAQGRIVAVPIEFKSDAQELYLGLYGTGLRYRTSLANVKARIGTLELPVQYAGSQNTFVGLDQVNVLLPRSLSGAGEVDVVLVVDGKVSNAVKVNFK